MQRFEHYELVTGEDGKPVELGRGAMGVTYKGYDIDLQCPVALKVISVGINTKPDLLMFYYSNSSSSITLLSRIIDLLRECRAAIGTASGRSQQPRPDRFQDLLQRQTRSFFLPQGKLLG